MDITIVIQIPFADPLYVALQATTKIHITIVIQTVIAELNITILIQIPVTRLDDFLICEAIIRWITTERNPMK